MSSPSAEEGAAAYTPFQLRLYDALVLGFVSRVAWRCSPARMQDQYQRHLTGRHLDLGPGTGYFLDRCGLPGDAPHLVLVDLNLNSLRTAAQRLRRYDPVSLRRDVLEPLDLGSEYAGPRGFGSVGMNFLLHCLPGDFAAKGVVFEHLQPYLAPGARVFGATVVADPEAHRHPLSRLQLWWLNRSGVFHNMRDRTADLEAVLTRHFAHVEVRRVGAVALFEAHH